jgi:hypothetical protein
MNLYLYNKFHTEILIICRSIDACFKKKYIVLFFSLLFPTFVYAGNWNFDASGLIGAYYGVANAKEETKYPQRLISRADATLKGEYIFNEDHRTGIHASTTIIFKEDDKNRSEGEYRFYPYLIDKSKLGEFYLGYTYNAAYMLHKGAKDITFLKVDDSNATYFLSNPNWDNGYKDTLYATPKSTAILNDGRAVKVAYILPLSNDIKVGFSYTPDNAHRRGMISRYVDYEETEDGYALGAQKNIIYDDHIFYVSTGYGIFNRTDKELSLGFSWEYKNFNAAMGYKKSYVDGDKNPISLEKLNDNLPAYFDNYRESEAWNISVGYQWNNYKTNLAYLNTAAENTRHQDNLLLWSNVYSLDNHVELYAMSAYLNNHGYSLEDDNRGYAVIGGIGFRF